MELPTIGLANESSYSGDAISYIRINSDTCQQLREMVNGKGGLRDQLGLITGSNTPEENELAREINAIYQIILHLCW
jgi:hypothetical protein